MTTAVRLISGVGYTPASPDEVRHGLLGFVTCTFADLLLLDGLTHRVTESGRHTLSFPSRADKLGRRHPFFRPQNDRARRIIEKAVFDRLGIEQGVGDER